MSIYATLWTRKIAGEYVTAQGVPGHIGWEYDTPYYDSFLPPRVAEEHNGDGTLRAVVFVDDYTSKIGQQYIHPLLMLTGEEYAAYQVDAYSKRELAKRLGKIVRERKKKV